MVWVFRLFFISLLGFLFYWHFQDSDMIIDKRYVSGFCKENHVRKSDEYQGEIIKIHNAWENHSWYEGYVHRLYLFDKELNLHSLQNYDYTTPIAYELMLYDFDIENNEYKRKYKFGDSISSVNALPSDGSYWSELFLFHDKRNEFMSRCSLDYIKQDELKKVRTYKSD